MRQSREIRFSRDHPTAAGHFPGNPVIPGAVLLDEVLRAIAGTEAQLRPTAIRSAKFLHVVRPGDALLISWGAGHRGEIKFEGRLLDQQRLALTGTIELGAAPR